MKFRVCKFLAALLPVFLAVACASQLDGKLAQVEATQAATVAKVNAAEAVAVKQESAGQPAAAAATRAAVATDKAALPKIAATVTQLRQVVEEAKADDATTAPTAATNLLTPGGWIAAGLAIIGLAARSYQRGQIATKLIEANEFLKKVSPAVDAAFKEHASGISAIQGPATKTFVDGVTKPTASTPAVV